MAKIFKISGYYVDPNDDFTARDLEVWLQQDIDAIGHYIEVREADIGEWDDNSPLNGFNCLKSECEKYFGDTPKQKYGVWVKMGYEGCFTRCSECDARAPRNNHSEMILSHYCPNCGLPMLEEAENE